MKRIALFLIVILCILAFAACSDDPEVTRVENDETVESEETGDAPEAEVSHNVATVGQTLDRGGIQFTFDRAERYVDESDFVMDTAADGYEFILLWFSVYNATEESYHINMFSERSYLDGVSTSPVVLLFGVDGETLWGDVSADRTRIGFVGYEVPIGWSEIEFRYTPLFAGDDSALIFTVTPADLA